jgi:hypothetical protein
MFATQTSAALAQLACSVNEDVNENAQARIISSLASVFVWAAALMITRAGPARFISLASGLLRKRRLSFSQLVKCKHGLHTFHSKMSAGELREETDNGAGQQAPSGTWAVGRKQPVSKSTSAATLCNLQAGP